MDATEIETLRTAIREQHGVEATWTESVIVREFVNRRLIWEGEVQVFRILHPLTSRCYAWVSANKVFAVLHVEPISSAAEAVRATQRGSAG